MKPHKHAKLIKAWADGAQIQILTDTVDGPIWTDINHPGWNLNNEYRIKPPEKVSRWLWAFEIYGKWKLHDRYFSESEAFQWFDEKWQCNHKKLEWTRMEFDE